MAVCTDARSGLRLAAAGGHSGDVRSRRTSV